MKKRRLVVSYLVLLLLVAAFFIAECRLFFMLSRGEPSPFNSFMLSLMIHDLFFILGFSLYKKQRKFHYAYYSMYVVYLSITLTPLIYIDVFTAIASVMLATDVILSYVFFFKNRKNMPEPFDLLTGKLL